MPYFEACLESMCIDVITTLMLLLSYDYCYYLVINDLTLYISRCNKVDIITASILLLQGGHQPGKVGI